MSGQNCFLLERRQRVWEVQRRFEIRLQREGFLRGGAGFGVAAGADQRPGEFVGNLRVAGRQAGGVIERGQGFFDLTDGYGGQPKIVPRQGVLRVKLYRLLEGGDGGRDLLVVGQGQAEFG